jgi:hypothetical protein
MIKQFISATMLIVATLIASPAKAGFFDKLADRVQDRVENVVAGKVAKKAEDKAGEATDAVINSESNDQQEELNPNTYQSVTSQGSQPEQSNPMSGMGDLGGMLKALQQKADIESNYSFDLKIKSEITSEGEANVMEQSFSSDAFHVKIDDNQSMIMDMKNEAMIMIDEKAKTKSAMSSKFLKQMAKMGGAKAMQQKAQSPSIDRIKRTGKTREILGYESDQWVYEDGRDRGELWVTEEIDFDFVDFNKRVVEMFDNGSGQFSVDFSQLQGKFPNGMPLEMTNYVDGQVNTKMRVLSVSEKLRVVDLSPYREQSMLNQ